MLLLILNYVNNKTFICLIISWCENAGDYVSHAIRIS